jgi:2-succinyl-6-hydroxy-2,4-cyclohexadiene-1-carboxylate synthase
LKASYVQVEGVRHYLYEAGEGPPVLLLHGFTGSSSSFEQVVAVLQSDFHVVAVDLIGHGRTDAPAAAEPYRLNRVVNYLMQLMDARGHGTFACLGYSMGGRTGLALACEFPERVSALVLESASPGLKTTIEQMQRIQRDEALADWIEDAGIDAFVDYWGKIPLFQSQMALSDSEREREDLIRDAGAAHYGIPGRKIYGN